ncbi:MAG: hypothetical protein UT99_C0005G0037 [Candidatus Curtissbacteria bacterium GW2011_GWA2_40_31]|nr:MAG: hypothetical protein UT99_C0005G0037 [Candidatus Curtissbacteria bacterium GW2011_GWA2_40_31]
MTKKPIIKFSAKAIRKLSASEKRVVTKLIDAAEAISAIYEQQENSNYLGANFYPHDVTKEEIVKAARHNKAILSPYTMVEKNKKGELIAIPYHVKFVKQLEKVARLVKEAAKITQNHDFAKRLEVQANSLLDGNYETSDIYWLSLKPYKINFVIGPIERYDDKLFFTKCAYQSWVGIMDEQRTSDTTVFKNYIVSGRRKVLAPSEKVDFLDKIQIRVDDSFDIKFNAEHHPIFHAIFEGKFQQGYPIDVLKMGSLRNSYLHEISHTLLRYRDSERRLKEYFPVFDEISASIYGVKACGSLLLKDVISQKELEAIMVMFVARAFSWWTSYLKEPSIIHYAQGFAIALNYFLESGAIREAGGFSWPNFTKLFVSINELADTLERILAVGTYEDAQHFVEKYASLEIFERFRPNLKKLI